MPDPNNTMPSGDFDAASFDSALAASAPQIGKPLGAEPPAPVPEPAPTPTQASEPAPAPDAEPAAEVKPADDKPKRGIDALSAEKKEEEKKAAEAKGAEEPEPEIDTSKWNKAQRDAFAAARVKEKTLKSELNDTKTKFERLQKEFEEFKKAPRDSEKTVKELEELRNWRHAQELYQSPEWQDTINKPLSTHLDMLGRIAEKAGVDAEALAKATDEELLIDRIDAINKVFETADTPVPSHYVTAAIQEAEKMHAIYDKGMTLKAKAGETLNSIKHQTTQQKEAAAKAEEAEYTKHHEHIYSQMAEKMPSVFKDEALAKAVRDARPAKDPAERAFQAQAAEVLPTIFQQLLQAREALAAEKASKQALLGTRATITPTKTATRPANFDDTEMDEAGFDAALSRR